MRPRLLLVLTALLAALALPAAAQAADPTLELKIENQSTVPDSEVWITVYTNKPPADFEVPGFENDVPRTLESIGHTLTIEKLVAGRIYVAYGPSGVTHSVGFDSQTRFDWIELTYTPSTSDVANLTAVEQFGIGMRLNTYGTSGEPLEELSSANADTIFDALQGIPGGPGATVRNGKGEILRVLSPLQSNAYPDLGEYVRSMAGQTIHLHSTFSGENSGEFTTSEYSGIVEADGSITLEGEAEGTDPTAEAISMPGPELIEDVYTGRGTPNNFKGAVEHDVLVGFMAGYWDGKYGNDAIDFCDNADTSGTQPFCPTGFNQPAFADARPGLSPFPTYEQYAAVINQYADMYGNPYSDGASGKVTIPIDQTGGKDVGALKLTILCDSASSGCGGGSSSGSGSGAGGGGGGSTPSSGAEPGSSSSATVHARLLKHSKLLRHGKLRVAHLACSGTCGRVQATVRVGKRVLARAVVKRAGHKQFVVAHLTKPGRKLLRRHKKLKTRLGLSVTPPGQRATHFGGKLLLIR